MAARKAVRPAAKPAARPAAKQAKPEVDVRTMSFVAYILGWLTGLIVFLIAKDNEELKFHGMQSILLSVATIVVGMLLTIVLIGFLVFPLGWLYGIYIGYKAYQGERVLVPVLGEYAEKFAKS
ncbi:MAG: hypothetical protein QXG98_03655 [Candidatus Micrarchaeia archaeon]